MSLKNFGLAALVTCVVGMAACGSDDSSTSDGGTSSDATLFGDGVGFGGDAATTCQPRTCASAGYTCGLNGDGCGGVIDCGHCAQPNFCGGGGYSKCGIGVNADGGSLISDGGSLCTPTTCQQLGYNCGPAGDGCGGLLQCGSCTSPDICGGGGKPSVCGGGTPCTNLCLQQVTCDGGASTTLTGRVVAGTLSKYGNPDPVPNVIVYVPNGTVQAFTKGVQCSQCGADVTGNPLVQTTTGVDGKFSLANVPVGTSIPVVIQLGRWRRQLTFSVPACTSTATGDIHMPRNKNEGDIPFTALSTGDVDAMECVLLKMGVDQGEFTDPGGGGRIEIYQGNGAVVSKSTPAESTLVNTTTALDQYDQVFFPCWGSQVNKGSTPLANLVSYGDAGGRVFATHFSYTWLYTNTPWNKTATWNVNAAMLNSTTGEIDTSFTKGKTFAQWLGLVGALTSTNPPQMTINSPRHDFDAVTSPALRWMYTVNENPDFPLHYTFDTPWGQTSQCGRVVFSDFHVTGSNTSGTTFPNECNGNAMTSQEKALEYMIWDLASCVPPPPKPACTPLTCAQQNIACGPAGDGCGNLLNCGTCSSNQTCGGGGYGQCGVPDAGSCTPMTCAQLGFNCGPAGDGCGNLLDCGTCTLPDTCGGAGQSGVCGHVTVH